MKSFIVVLCIAAVIFANPCSGEKGLEKIKGCEDAKDVKGIKVNECCTGLPQVFGTEAWKTCSADKTDFCEKSTCVMKTYGVTDDAGKFDAKMAIEYIKKAANNDAFPAETIVNNCVTAAPEETKALVAKWAEKNDKKSDKKCDNLENFVIPHCIRRQLILTCPTWVKSDNCDKLQTFAKSCPAYPFFGKGGNKGKGGKGSKAQAKSEAQ